MAHTVVWLTQEFFKVWCITIGPTSTFAISISTRFTVSQQSLRIETTISVQLKAAHTTHWSYITQQISYQRPLTTTFFLYLSYLAWLCVIRKCCFPVGLLFHPSPNLALLAPRLFHPTLVSSTFSLIQLVVDGDERIEGSKSGEHPTDNTAIKS